MASDDLNRPLGMEKPSRGLAQRGVAIAVGIGVTTAVMIGFAALLLYANPKGGEPFAVAAIPPQKPVPPRDDRTPTASIRSPAPAANPTGLMENGVSVFRAGKSETGPGPLVIKVPQALGLSEIAAVDKHLIEMTRYGPIPKIAADGARASDVYARPPVFEGAIRPGTPRIAIYVSGLGSNPAAAEIAVTQMPAAVSLAFTPYGEKLDGAVNRAKAAGHEVLLQIPTEATGDGDQGPHTLQASAPPKQTIDDLYWLMSRMSGYVGVSTFPGGPFTADPAAMTTMLREIGGRGLLYVEGGTRKGMTAAELAANLGVPEARSDVVLDAAGTPDALRVALVKLEATARDKGSAVGVVAGTANLAAVAEFARALDAKGIALVPVSALANAPTPSMAATP